MLLPIITRAESPYGITVLEYREDEKTTDYRTGSGLMVDEVIPISRAPGALYLGLYSRLTCTATNEQDGDKTNASIRQD